MVQKLSKAIKLLQGRRGCTGCWSGRTGKN